MSDLTDFLLARIAEDEARAEHWFETWREGGLIDLTLTPGPGRVLAECAVKRQIVADCTVTTDLALLGQERIVGAFTAFERVVSRLATAYAAHPEYRDEWRP